MKLEAISNNIDIIIANELKSKTVQWFPRDKSKIFDLVLQGKPLEDLDEENSNYVFKSKNFELLKSLLGRLKTLQEIDYFYSHLKTYLLNKKFDYSLIIIFLMKTDGIQPTLKYLEIEVKKIILDYPFHEFLQSLIFMIIHEHYVITDEEVKDLKIFVDLIESKLKTKTSDLIFPLLKNNLIDKIGILKSQLSAIEYNRLSQDLLTGINFEVNRDKEEVFHYLEKFGFSNELIKSIEYVENAYQSAKSDFDYKTCTDHLRSFTSVLINETAVSIAKYFKEPLPDKNFHIYLKSKKFFASNKESDLFQAFRNYLSSDSVHRLSGEKEMARISKNICVEFALMMTQRLEGFISEKQ